MIFDGRENLIREKKPFFGHLDFPLNNYTWNEHMFLMDSHPDHLLDENSEKFRIGLNAFHLRGSAPSFAKEIVNEMNGFFYNHENKITNIAFCGFGKQNKSYPYHRDSMDVLLIQVIRTIRLKIEGFDERKFEPMDYVWIPRGIKHKIIPSSSRVTFSFGVEGNPDPCEYI